MIDGTTGFVIDAAEDHELIDRVTHLLRHPDEARDMGRAGRAHVAANYSAASPPPALLEWLGTPIR